MTFWRRFYERFAQLQMGKDYMPPQKEPIVPKSAIEREAVETPGLVIDGDCVERSHDARQGGR